MKILILNNEYPPVGGGGSILTSYIAKNLVKDGHDVTLITSSYANLATNEKVDGYTVIRTKCLRGNPNSASYLELLSYNLSSLFMGIRVIRKSRPDIIQAHFAVPAGGTAMVLSMLFGIPYAVYLGGSDAPDANPDRHGKIYPLVIPIIKTILAHAKLVTVCSDLLIDKIHRHQPTLKVYKIPNGVDIHDFVVPKSKPSLPPIKIVGVGRIIPRKGFQFLIEALSRLDDKIARKFYVTIIGSGDYREELKKMAINGKVDQYIEFIDAVPYKDLKRYYQRSHVFCLPSLAEGMPLAMLEAMACGNVLITTDVAGNQELVVKGKNGYLVQPGQSEGIQYALEDLVAHKYYVRKKGLESSRIAQKYDWDEITKKYVMLYKKVVNKSHENSHNRRFWLHRSKS